MKADESSIPRSRSARNGFVAGLEVLFRSGANLGDVRILCKLEKLDDPPVRKNTKRLEFGRFGKKRADFFAARTVSRSLSV